MVKQSVGNQSYALLCAIFNLLKIFTEERTSFWSTHCLHAEFHAEADIYSRYESFKGEWSLTAIMYKALIIQYLQRLDKMSSSLFL